MALLHLEKLLRRLENFEEEQRRRDRRIDQLLQLILENEITSDSAWIFLRKAIYLIYFTISASVILCLSEFKKGVNISEQIHMFQCLGILMLGVAVSAPAILYHTKIPKIIYVFPRLNSFLSFLMIAALSYVCSVWKDNTWHAYGICIALYIVMLSKLLLDSEDLGLGVAADHLLQLVPLLLSFIHRKTDEWCEWAICLICLCFGLFGIFIGSLREKEKPITIPPKKASLLQPESKIWEESVGESPLQIQQLIALRSFVIALGDQSPLSYSTLLPILQKGINVNSPDELNLLEDGMQLWEATISHAPSMVPQLLGYFPCLLKIMERSLDHLQVAVKIIEGYIILGGSEFVSMHAFSIANLLDMIVSKVNDRGLLSVLPVIDLLIQCFPADVPPMISSTLQKLITICLSGGDDGDPSKTAVKASSAAILARILVMNTNYLMRLTSHPLATHKLPKDGVDVEGFVLLCLVDLWLDKVANASSTQRKTFGLALSTILTLRLPQVLNKLDRILSACTALMGGADDVKEAESSGDDLELGRTRGDAIPSIESRRRQLKFSDPVNQLSLKESVRENMQKCASIHGDFFKVIQPDTFARLQEALK